MFSEGRTDYLIAHPSRIKNTINVYLNFKNILDILTFEKDNYFDKCKNKTQLIYPHLIPSPVI